MNSRRVRAVLVAALLTPLAAVPSPLPAAAAEAGFSVQTVWGGLNFPTNIEFAANGLVFVSLKNGIVRAFNGLGDTTSVISVDLRQAVHNFWDRGMLGMAVDPAFGIGNRLQDVGLQRLCHGECIENIADGPRHVGDPGREQLCQRW